MTAAGLTVLAFPDSAPAPTRQGRANVSLTGASSFGGVLLFLTDPARSRRP